MLPHQVVHAAYDRRGDEVLHINRVGHQHAIVDGNRDIRNGFGQPNAYSKPVACIRSVGYERSSTRTLHS